MREFFFPNHGFEAIGSQEGAAHTEPAPLPPVPAGPAPLRSAPLAIEIQVDWDGSAVNPPIAAMQAARSPAPLAPLAPNTSSRLWTVFAVLIILGAAAAVAAILLM